MLQSHVAEIDRCMFPEKDGLLPLSSTSVAALTTLLDQIRRAWGQISKSNIHLVSGTFDREPHTKRRPPAWNSVTRRHVRYRSDVREGGRFRFRFQIAGRLFRVHVVYPPGTKRPSKRTVFGQIYQMWTWLVVACSHATRQCATDITVKLTMANRPKRRPPPGKPVTEEHVNSAYTYACVQGTTQGTQITPTQGPTQRTTTQRTTTSSTRPKNTITVYRSEEWFKVFIHETFHCLGLDWSGNGNDAILLQNMQLATLFPGTRVDDYRFYEAYTETWADIVHLCFVSLSEHNDSREDLPSVIRGAQLERTFSLIQANKLLGTQGTTLEEIALDETATPESRTLYTETVSAFSYFVLRSFFLVNLSAFIEATVSASSSTTDRFLCAGPSVPNKLIDLIRTERGRLVYLLKKEGDHACGHDRPQLVTDTMRMTCVEKRVL